MIGDISSLTGQLTPTPLSGADAALSPNQSRNHQDLDAIARDFESVFLTQMLQHMFSGDEANAYFGGGAAGDIYKGFLMDEYGKAIANTGGIGIASSVKQELLKLQEVSS